MNHGLIRQGLYTIPSGTGFLKRLAEGLLAMSEGDDFALTRMRVLLPTRRAGRELRDAFLSLSHDKPLLLPRLQPIGDVDGEEIELYLSGFGEIGHEIPPAISALERQFLLAPLIQQKDSSLGVDAALSLANELARLIDTVYTEDLDFSNLSNIVPSTLASHWQKTLQFLEIVTEFWPKILAERGQIDPADRRNRLLKSLTTLWYEHPPSTPVIAAGSTGSIPSVGNLLKTIANLPQGIVVLPGLDLGLEDESWSEITDTHPQCTMRNLLNRMGKTREDVQFWPECKKQESQRIELIRAIMRPTQTFGKTEITHLKKGLENLDIIEAGTAREEASVIALALREVMETKDKTACFVTPDRTLARRVMTALHRWGIQVDDSAGGALATTKGATFLMGILRVIQDDFAPLPLLDFLKHHYQLKIDQDSVHIFERHVLRGSRPANGLIGLQRRLSKISNQNQELGHLVEILSDKFSPLIDLSTRTHSLDMFCQSLLKVAENFAGGQDRLWMYPESDALSKFISSVIGYSDLISSMTLPVFVGVFRELLTAEKYRSDDEPHRRILILGQLESRLIHRDIMILGGLNEGTWPKDSGPDPWMSRPMRSNFGLPPPDRLTGLAAHDFAEHLSAERVFITRSLKVDGAASVPARWLQKLRTLLTAEGLLTDWANQGRYLGWVKQMDSPKSMTPLSASMPEPSPPLHVRPTELSATWIEKWMKNPYRVYAEKILKIKIIEPLDKNTIHAERGSFVHDVLLDFVRDYPDHIPDNAENIIIDIAKTKILSLENVQPHWHYWWPRFERLVSCFVSEEKKWREDYLPWIQEETGKFQVYNNTTTGRTFTVTAKADRIDRLKTGGGVIIDYKTGNIPAVYKMKNGNAPQLPIESLILSKGGYKSTPYTPHQMAYWKLSGSYASAGEINIIKLDMEEVISSTENGLLTLIETFEDSNTPYIAKVIIGQLYDDEKAYAHLARIAEWSSGGYDDAEDTGDAE